MKATKKQIGIEYTLTGSIERGQVTGYHRKPEALKLNKTPYRVDIAGLKTAGVRQAIKIDGAVYESKFTIGMEVEKNNLHRGAVREYELFCGFERDGSCGYEAVTHILPLLPESKWRTKIYDMMHKAEKIIDDRYSPSSSNCGGHITLAVDGLTGAQLNNEVRKYSGIVLAMFRNRLKNVYCGANRRMQASGLDGMYNSAPAGRGTYDYNGWHYKYQTALVKGDLLEFRLPSRFESVKQMMRRYELMYELVNFAVNVQGTQKAFFAKIRPIILSMYNGETEKTDEIFKLAVDFQKFINTGVISDAIAQYLR
jgi:hypothetical protein